jgi:hypothetical protein
MQTTPPVVGLGSINEPIYILGGERDAIVRDIPGKRPGLRSGPMGTQSGLDRRCRYKIRGRMSTLNIYKGKRSVSAEYHG